MPSRHRVFRLAQLGPQSFTIALDSPAKCAILPAMSHLLDQRICLQLNAHWQPIGIRSVKESVVALCSESNGEPPAFALDIEMDGDDLVFANPVTWDVWVTLSVRPDDLYIQTAHGKIRAPTVIVARNFRRMPFKRPRLTSGAIYERDKGVCQYTGEYVGRANGNLDHIVPRDRGGRDSFDNLVWCKKDVNSRKGNRLNHEAGLRLINKPTEPPSLPVSATITECKHPTWGPFLIRTN